MTELTRTLVDSVGDLVTVVVGDLLTHQLSDPEQAESFYREALRRDPLNFEASEALQALLEGGEDFQRLTDFLQQHVQTLTQMHDLLFGDLDGLIDILWSRR